MVTSQNGADQGRPDDAHANGEEKNIRRRREDSDAYAQEQRRAEDFQVLQTRALELAAEDRPLREALDELMRTVEARSSTGVLGSILLVDKDGRHLVHGAGPSLPAAYNAAIDGIDIGTGVGSCGTAAAENRPVHVSNIAVDPLWTDFQDLALSHGLRACWSTPIRSRGGEVLGTFAMYYSQPREPSPTDLATVDVVTRAAALLIGRRRTIAALADSEERLRLAVDNAEIGFWDVDLVHDLLIWPPRTKAMFGISPEVPVVSADVILTHPAEVKVTHLVEDDGLFGAVDVEPGGSDGHKRDGSKGRRREVDRAAARLLAQHRAAVHARGRCESVRSARAARSQARRFQGLRCRARRAGAPALDSRDRVAARDLRARV